MVFTHPISKQCLLKKHLHIQSKLTNFLLDIKTDRALQEIKGFLLTDKCFDRQLLDLISHPDIGLEAKIEQSHIAIVKLFDYLSKSNSIIFVEDTLPIYNFYGLDIVNRLRLSGYYSWSVLNDKRPSSSQHLQIGPALLEELTCVSVILCSTRDLSKISKKNGLYERSQKPINGEPAYATPIGFSFRKNQHTKILRTPTSPNIQVGEHLIFDSDFISVPNTKSAIRIYAKYKRARPYLRKLVSHRRQITLVPLGNPKISRSIVKREQRKRLKEKNILFFLGPYDVSTAIDEKLCCDLIREILREFDDVRLVFRPHPEWIDHPRTEKITAIFREDPRFFFDTASSSEDAIVSGDALVTDNSNSGLTFSLISAQPSIYINPELEFFDSKNLNFKFEDGTIFKFLNTKDKIIGFLRKQIRDPASTLIDRVAIPTYTFSHSNNSEEYFLNVIRAIVSGRQLADWKVLEIEPRDISDDAIKCLANLSENDILPVAAYPYYVTIDIELLPMRTKGKIFYNLIEIQNHHSSYIVNLLIWTLENILAFGFSEYKGLLLSALIRTHARSNMRVNWVHRDRFIKSRIIQVSQTCESEKSKIEWIEELLEAYNSNEKLQKLAGKQIGNFLDKIGGSCEIFWRTFVKQSREKEGRKVALFGAGNYSKHLLEHVLVNEFRPDFLIETKPINKHLIVEDGTAKIDIVSVEQIESFCGSIIIASPVFEKEIQTKLLSMDILGSDLEIINPFQIADTYFPLTLWH